MIRTVRPLVYLPNRSQVQYQTDDGARFDSIEEAVEHENKITASITKDVVPEQIWTVQQAINMAIAENRVVRFESRKSNKELKKEIVDLKGCKLMKPEKNSECVAVIPPSITNYVF